MGKFCKTYQIPCVCLTCKDVECNRSPRTRGEAEILRGVKLSADGRVLDEEGPAHAPVTKPYSEPKGIAVNESILIAESPQAAGRRRAAMGPAALIVAAIASASVLLIGTYFIIESLKPKKQPLLTEPAPAEVVEVAKTEPEPAPAEEAVTEASPKETLSIDEVLEKLKAKTPPQSELPPPPPIEQNLAKKLEKMKEEGNIHVKKGEFAKAREVYQAAIEADPMFFQGYNNLANTFNDEGKHGEAEPIYRKGLEIEPKSSNLRFNLGNSHFRAGRYEQAILEFDQVLQVNPKDLEAHLLAGVAHFKLSHFEQAANHFQAITILNPESADAYYNLSLAYRRQGQEGLAMVYYRDAIRLNPGLRTIAKN
jgi:tetratricopeptide (TPR) repeat protein